MPTDLLDESDPFLVVAGVTSNGIPRYWGPHFPDARNDSRFWAQHFPDRYVPAGTVIPSIPQGAGAFLLVLESGTVVTYEFTGSLFKAKSGVERRTSTGELPNVSFDSKALLLGERAISNRARIARYAALGKHFLLGLPFEEMIITVDSPSYQIQLDAQQIGWCDWANPGQRVIIEEDDGDAMDATIQDADATTITIDKELGTLSRKNSRVMPAIGLFLDPSQTFTRYTNPETVEAWTIKGKAMVYDFAGSEAVASFLSLDPPQTNSGVLDGLQFVATTPGIAGDDIRVRMRDNALTAPGDYIEAGDDVTVDFTGGETTVQQFIDLVNNAGGIVRVVGDPIDPNAFLQNGDDEFAYAPLDGGRDSIGYVGRGATVATYWFKPVWNRRIVADTTVDDQVQSLAQIIQLGPIPFTQSDAQRSDWGRGVFYRRNSIPEWQWLKKFMYTVKGSWKTFWLPSWRADLQLVSSTTGELVVESGEGAGDFFAWWQTYHIHLQLLHASDAVTYVRVSNAVDNNDGTLTLTILDEADTPATLPGSAIVMVSWLELCRFEKKTFSVEWNGPMFTFDEIARVVQR